MPAPTFNTKDMICKANEPYPISALCDVFVIDGSPAGVLTMKTAQGEFRCFPGRVYGVPGQEINLISLKDTLAETVAITYGYGTIIQPGGGGAGPVIPVPLPVQGTYPFYTPTAVTPASVPGVPVTMFRNIGGPNPDLPTPLRSTEDQNSLSVGFTDRPVDFIGPLIPGAGAGGNTAGQAGLLFYVSLIAPGDTGSLLDANSQPIPFWDSQGRYYPTGVFGFPGEYYADVRATGAYSFQTALTNAGNVSLEARFTVNASAPVTIVHPAAAQLSAVVTGAFAAGLTNLLPAQVGKSYRVFGYNVSLAAANDLQFQSTTGAALSARGYGVLGGSETDLPIFTTALGQGLSLWLLNAAPAGVSVNVRFEVI